MAITIKIVRVPGAVTELVLEDGATVNDALQAASITLASGEKLQLNAVDTTTDAVLSDGDRIYIAKGAKNA